MEPPVRRVSPLHRFPEHTKAIGMITIEMGALEACCALLLAAILQTTEGIADAILMTPASTRARLDVLKAVAGKVLPEECARRVSKLISRCDIALNKRNSIVHSIWGSDGKNVIMIPTPKGKHRQVEISELNQQIETLRRLADRVNLMTDEIRYRKHYSINVTYNVWELK